MPSWTGWALAAVVLLVVAVALWLRLRGKGANILKAGAKLVATWHAAQAQQTQARVDALKEDFEQNADKIKVLEDKLAIQKQRLAKDLNTQGMDAQQIADEFSKLDL